MANANVEMWWAKLEKSHGAVVANVAIVGKHLLGASAELKDDEVKLIHQWIAEEWGWSPADIVVARKIGAGEMPPRFWRHGVESERLLKMSLTDLRRLETEEFKLKLPNGKGVYSKKFFKMTAAERNQLISTDGRILKPADQTIPGTGDKVTITSYGQASYCTSQEVISFADGKKKGQLELGTLIQLLKDQAELKDFLADVQRKGATALDDSDEQ